MPVAWPSIWKLVTCTHVIGRHNSISGDRTFGWFIQFLFSLWRNGCYKKYASITTSQRHHYSWNSVFSCLCFRCQERLSRHNYPPKRKRERNTKSVIYIYIYIYIYIIIIIIMSRRLHGYPWPFLATFPYRSSTPAGLLDYIPYLHIEAVCMFELVVLLLLGHKWGSIGVHHLWARLPAVSCVPGSSNLDNFHDGRQVAV